MNRKQEKAIHAKLIRIRKSNHFFKSDVADTICKSCGKKTTHQFTKECVSCGIKRHNNQRCMFCGKPKIHHHTNHEFVGE